MRKKILLLMVMLLISIVNVKAVGCDYSTVSRLKSLVSNINITYSYHISENYVYFDVTLTNITPNMYFWDSVTNQTYTYNDTVNGEITLYNYDNQSGSYKFYSLGNGCSGDVLGTKYYKFPIYNIYYNDPLCSDIPNFSLCQKWVSTVVDYDRFESAVYEYKAGLNNKRPKEDNVEYNKNFLDILVELYIEYYYYFLIAIILICGSIIFIKQRKNKFKL